MNKFTKKFIIMLFLLLISSGFACYAGTNLIKNPSFEEESGIKPSYWETTVWDKTKGVSECLIESGDAHTGNMFATIKNNKENDTRYRQKIDVKGDTLYKFSCWIKAVGVGLEKKGANLSVEYTLAISDDIKETSNEWKNVEVYIKTPIDMTSLVITVGLGGYYSTNYGKPSFDDVSFEEVTNVPKDKKVFELQSNNGNNKSDTKSVGEKKGPDKLSPDKSNVHLIVVLTIIVVIIVVMGLGYYRRKNKSIFHEVEPKQDEFDLETENVDKIENTKINHTQKNKEKGEEKIYSIVAGEDRTDLDLVEEMNNEDDLI